MHTRHARKAKSAAADFVKRVISGHDSSPGPSSKSKSQPTKTKQPVPKTDASRSPSRGRSPASSGKGSPSAKVVPKSNKVVVATSCKSSPSAKELLSQKLKANEKAKELHKDQCKQQPVVAPLPKHIILDVSKADLTRKNETIVIKETFINKDATTNKAIATNKDPVIKNEVVVQKEPCVNKEPTRTLMQVKVASVPRIYPEVILINSDDESPAEKEPGEVKKKVLVGQGQFLQGINAEYKKRLIEQAKMLMNKEPIANKEKAKLKKSSEVKTSMPQKRGRGRPRKVPLGEDAPVPANPVKKKSKPTGEAPKSQGKRPRGRPRKYPPGMSAIMYKQKLLERNEIKKVMRKSHSQGYSYPSMHRPHPMGSGGIGALTIKIKEDYMLQEGGMVSPRHPTIMCEQEEFFKIFGLIKKSELEEMNRRTHTLHRAAGGKLRRLIKPKICPEMVYRNFMLNKSTAIGVQPDEWDSSDEYDESGPKVKLVKSHSAPSTPDHRALLGSPGKVNLLQKDDELLKMKAGPWSSPEDCSGSHKKQWLKPPPKTPKRSSIEDALEAARELQNQAAAKLKKLEKPVLKKQKSEPYSKSKVVKLECKSKSMEPSKKHPAVSSYRFKPTGGFRPLAPPPKPEDEDGIAKPSRRSARNQGGKRKQWWHLLRANPDEYIPDHKWDEEVASKEKKKQDRIKRKDNDERDEDMEEYDQMEEEEEEEREPGEVVIIEKPKKKKKKKVLLGELNDEEIAILEAEERAMEERNKREQQKGIASPVKSALKRKLDQDSEEMPGKKMKTDDSSDRPSSPSVIAKKKKKKKKLKDRGKYHYIAKVDKRGSVLSILKGSRCKEYLIFDSGFNLVSMHDDSNMYQLTANAVVQLAKQEGWTNLGQEVIEIVLPNKLVKDKLRSRICERMSPYVISTEEDRERACITPHMCQVCWINDHMYCANMKRTSRNLVQGASCLHYTLCNHYRNLSPNEIYARYATVAQFGNGGITKNFSISRLNDRSLANSSKILSEEGTSITISGGRLTAKDKRDGLKGQPITITVNNAVGAEMEEKKQPKKVTDLVCYEELQESDSEPSTPGQEGSKSADLLTKHLFVRARQIAQSLGYSNVKEAMEALKKNAIDIVDLKLEDMDGASIDEGDSDVFVQDYVEVQLQEFSDSDSECEEDVAKKKYGVPLSTKIQSCQHSVNDSAVKIHLMPVLSRSRSKFYIKCKDRKVMKVQFGGRAEYREEEQEWKVENDSYTIKDVTRKYHKKMNKLFKTKGTPESASERSKDSPHKQEKDASSPAVSSANVTPKVIWSTELNLVGQSAGRTKSSPEQPSKRQSNGDATSNTPCRRASDINTKEGFQSPPESEGKMQNYRSADSSPCLSQGSASSFTSTSSAQGQQLLLASPVKLPGLPGSIVPPSLQNHVSSGKDGSQRLTFTTKDIRECKPELIQYIKNANLIDMIHNTLTEERNSIEKLLKDGDGDADVSRLRDNLEQNECLLLAVRSESKEVKIKLVDLEMNLITEQNKSARLERRKEKLTSVYDEMLKKKYSFEKAIGKVQSLVQGLNQTVVQSFPSDSAMSLLPVDGVTTQTTDDFFTDASAAAQLPGPVAMATIVQPTITVADL